MDIEETYVCVECGKDATMESPYDEPICEKCFEGRYNPINPEPFTL